MSESSKKSSKNSAEFRVQIGAASGSLSDSSVIDVPFEVVPGDIPKGVLVEYDHVAHTLRLRLIYSGLEKNCVLKKTGDVEAQIGELTGRVYTLLLNNFKLGERVGREWQQIRDMAVGDRPSDRRWVRNLDFFSKVLNPAVTRSRAIMAR